MRRLTEEQFRLSIADIFGPDIKVAGRFEPELRTDGLLALGSGAVTVSPAGFEQYDAMARSIAGQVVDPEHRDRLLPCRPTNAALPDDGCARQTLAHYGRLLFRRPLDEGKLANRIAVAHGAAQTFGDFYAGLQFALTGLLMAPEFLFRADVTVPGEPTRLTGFSKATRLSYFLWNSTPDIELLRAAEAGELEGRAGLARQVDRLLASPRIEDGARAFFDDFLNFDGFDNLAKDAVLYPAFNQMLAADAREQTLRLFVDHLVTRRLDYRDLFTTAITPLTRRLGQVYEVPVAPRDAWDVQELGRERAGILTQISFLALHSHPGRSSPTLRGKAIREILLCESVPAPPPNVNFGIVQDTHNETYRTARARLEAHRSDATCAGCHKVMDPIGLALENYDALGYFRGEENGAPIDASGELNGQSFADAAGLGRVLHDSPQVSSCFVLSLYRYAVGRMPQPGEANWMEWLDRRFADGGHRMPALMRDIALSTAFYAVTPLSEGAGQEARR